MKPRKVSKEEFERRLKIEVKNARELAQRLGLLDICWFLDYSTDYERDFQKPCIYRSQIEGDSPLLTCPVSQKEFKRRHLPETFRVALNSEVMSLIHSSEIPCWQMNMGVRVMCFAEVEKEEKDGKWKVEYFITTHKVGKCPWKVKR